jgi:hypothetical protein
MFQPQAKFLSFIQRAFTTIASFITAKDIIAYSTIKATRTAKNSPQRNHKFINPFCDTALLLLDPKPVSVVALANETQNINWHLKKNKCFILFSFQLLLLSFPFGIPVAQLLLYVPFTANQLEQESTLEQESEWVFLLR